MLFFYAAELQITSSAETRGEKSRYVGYWYPDVILVNRQTKSVLSTADYGHSFTFSTYALGTSNVLKAMQNAVAACSLRLGVRQYR